MRALVIINDGSTRDPLREGLSRYNITCSFTAYSNGVREAITGARPDVFLLELGEGKPDAHVWELVRRARAARGVPVIALVPAGMLGGLDPRLEADDFIVAPYDYRELDLRIKRLLAKRENDAGAGQIECSGLVIDPASCEVVVNGAAVELTFKEYELLKLLASKRGRVFTREALLNAIWGYDYYGGDRTVDVHVRRLRGKIEDASHTYIETVRNIGYRFVKD